MNNTQLERVLALAQKMGDRVIVVPENNEPFVIMPLEAYERLATAPTVPLTEWVSTPETIEPAEVTSSDHIYLEPVA